MNPEGLGQRQGIGGEMPIRLGWLFDFIRAESIMFPVMSVNRNNPYHGENKTNLHTGKEVKIIPNGERDWLKVQVRQDLPMSWELPARSFGVPSLSSRRIHLRTRLEPLRVLLASYMINGTKRAVKAAKRKERSFRGDKGTEKW